MKIPFNVPFDSTGAFNEIMAASFDSKRLFSGKFAGKVKAFFKEHYPSEEVVLTSSCTNALELAALLLELKAGDEVIVPAYTYVSTANAFDLHGATLKFCDSCHRSPNMDLDQVEALITPRTRAIVAVHYAGFSVDMYRLLEIVRKHHLILIEDAAQGIHAFYDGRPLGSFGDLAVFSFHETKNITCGQGGALLINNKSFAERATILKNCGTNRHKFLLGLEDKYTWIDTGSVFNLPELCCAYLYPQLLHLDSITRKRKQQWMHYYTHLLPFQYEGIFSLPVLHELNNHNAHIFYIVLKSGSERDRLLLCLKERGIVATFHYVSLPSSPYIQKKYQTEPQLPNAEKFTHQLLRLPLYHELSLSEQDYILRCIADFFQESNSIKAFNNKLIGKIAGHLAGFSLLDEVLLNGIFA